MPRSRLLQRQLRALYPDGPPPELEPLLALVDESYGRYVADRALMERSLVLSSNELLDAGAEMRAVLSAVPDRFFVLDDEGVVRSIRSEGSAGGGPPPLRVDPVGWPIEEVAAGAPFGEALDKLRHGARVVHVENTQWIGGESRHFEFRLVRLGADRLLCIQRDVTDLRRAEEALRRSERHYRLLFDANPQPMWVFDRESLVFLAVNQAAIAHYGWSRDEFLAMRVTDIRPPEEIPALLDLLSRDIDRPLRPGVFRHRTRDGRLLDVETVGNPLLFYGRPAIMVLANDVTEQRRLQEQHRQTQRMEAVGQLAGGVAHDFNNLLTVIGGYGEMLLHSLADRPADLQRVQEIHRATARAASLTRQLLAFSRKQVLELRILDLDEVVQGMVPMLARLLGEHITLRAPRPGALGRVRADRGQLEQVVMNLAINARDAMPNGGTLTIELADVDLPASPGGEAALRSGPHVLLAVSDTGCGMDAGTRARIFEPFFTTKEVGRGTGLGLATVYGIVEQSEGSIAVESEPGRGSRFRILLPRVTEVPGEVDGGGPGRATAGRETLMVVEDEAEVRALECAILQEQGYEVLAASTADEALALERRHPGPIALVVTDVVMPGRSGRELAREFVRRRPGTPVLYVSGYANDGFVGGGLLDPGTWFLQKPFSPDALAGRVREILDREDQARAA